MPPSSRGCDDAPIRPFLARGSLSANRRYAACAPRRDVSTVATFFSTFATRFCSLRKVFSSLRPLVSAVEKRFSTLANLFSTFATRSSSLRMSFAIVEIHFAKLEKRSSTVQACFSTVAGRSLSLQMSFATVEIHFAKLAKRFASVQIRSDSVAPRSTSPAQCLPSLVHAAGNAIVPSSTDDLSSCTPAVRLVSAPLLYWSADEPYRIGQIAVLDDEISSERRLDRPGSSHEGRRVAARRAREPK
jgi:hypothetical protein